MLKTKILIRAVTNGMLGIASEIFVVAAMVVVSFLVCMIWWGVF